MMMDCETTLKRDNKTDTYVEHWQQRINAAVCSHMFQVGMGPGQT